MVWVKFVEPPSGERTHRQASALFHPFLAFASPVTTVDAVPSGKQFPGKPSCLKTAVVEQVKAAVIGQRNLPPESVGDEQVARLVRGVRIGRQQDRLTGIIGASCKAMRQEACRCLVPKTAIEPGKEALVLGNDKQSALALENLFGDACDHLLGGGSGKLVEGDLHF